MYGYQDLLDQQAKNRQLQDMFNSRFAEGDRIRKAMANVDTGSPQQPTTQWAPISALTDSWNDIKKPLVDGIGGIWSGISSYL